MRPSSYHPGLHPSDWLRAKEKSCCYERLYTKTSLFVRARAQLNSHFKPHKQTTTPPLHFAQAPLNRRCVAQCGHVTLHTVKLTVCVLIWNQFTSARDVHIDRWDVRHASFSFSSFSCLFTFKHLNAIELHVEFHKQVWNDQKIMWKTTYWLLLNYLFK